MIRALPLLLSLALGVAGCLDTATPGETGSTDVPASPDSASPDTPAGDVVGPDAPPPCGGEPNPWCADFCGSDWLVAQAECVDGAWVCSQGVVTTACPTGTCWGPPLPGETCGAGGWQCTPPDWAWQTCPALMCAVCDGFGEGPQLVEGCSCWCDGGEVRCEKVPGGCAGDPPLCAPGCGGDAFFGEAVCEGGAWTCEQGIPTSECPPGTCWGMPEVGEVCGPDGWQCQPDAQDLVMCPDVMCLTCDGFEPPIAVGCICWCDDSGVVRCKQVDGPDCGPTTTSSLAGVTLRIQPTKCAYSLDEAAAGLTFQYRITVDGTVGPLWPEPQDAGQCGQPDASGLIVFGRVYGGEQSYCLCDTGLCMGPSDTPTTLAPGVYEGTFAWDGVSWAGPSDTGNPKGAPFPPGYYTVSLSAVGQQLAPNDALIPFEAISTLEIMLFQ